MRPQPKFPFNALVDTETEELRRRLQERLDVSLGRLIAEALRALEEKIAATEPAE